MRRTSNLTFASHSASALRSLAELFPGATPMRISILVSVARGKGHLLEESTVIEFGTSTMVFFESRLPLELAEKLHLENADRSLGADAVVVGVRDGESHQAIHAHCCKQQRHSGEAVCSFSKNAGRGSLHLRKLRFSGFRRGPGTKGPGNAFYPVPAAG